jgi:hypothetical protein
MKTQRHEPIEGLPLAQNIHIEEAFEVLSTLGFERVIELGTQNGGFTIFLSLLFKRVITFDNKSFRNTLDVFKKYPKITFIEMDIFKKPDFVGKLISKEGKVLLLCDNGNKIKEVDTFSKYLKYGDYIMAHDYASTREHFKNEIQGNYWNCLEITDADIDFKKHGLQKRNSELNDKAAWFCAVKL